MRLYVLIFLAAIILVDYNLTLNSTSYRSSKEIFNQGIRLMKLKKYKESIAILKQIKETDIYYPLAVLNIGIMYYNLSSSNKNYLSETVKIYNYYLSNNIKLEEDKNWVNFEIKKYLGISLEALHKYKKAYKNLNKYNDFLEKNNYIPDFIFLISYGKVLVELKKYDEAIKYLLFANKIKANNFDVNYYLAQCYVNKKKLEEAEKYYRKAYSIDYTRPSINVELGIVLNMIYGRKSKKGNKFIVYGLKDKKYFMNLKKLKKTYLIIFKVLTISEIFEVYDYHYPKVKAVMLTLYIFLFFKYPIILYSILLFIILIMIYVFRKRLRFNIRYLVKK